MLLRKFRSNFQDLKFWIWFKILIFPQKCNLWPSFVPKPLYVTMVLARFLWSVQVLKYHEYFVKIARNVTTSWSYIVDLMRNCTQKRFFGFEARILRIGHFSGWKWKFFQISSWHFKHPIKLNFLIWHLEQPYLDQKSILKKRPFKSCPLRLPSP